MFYFLVTPIITYNIILIVAAVIPAIFLMVKVYRSDRLEKESTGLLGKLVRAGILSALLALVLEWIFGNVLEMAVKDQGLYQLLLYFVVVAVSEEGSKYFLLTKNTWQSPEFNCQFDGIVYGAFVALGFALWENISYVIHYGFSTAVVRAVTAIPGHMCFGIFMGLFYAVARKYENHGDHSTSILFRIIAVVVPVLLHGAYDYIASMETGTWYFVAFIAVLFIVSYFVVVKTSKEDQYI